MSWVFLCQLYVLRLAVISAICGTKTTRESTGNLLWFFYTTQQPTVCVCGCVPVCAYMYIVCVVATISSFGRLRVLCDRN